jgi:hypothetical protein
MANRYPTLEILVNGARGSRQRGWGVCKGPTCRRHVYWVATARGRPISFDEVPEVISPDGDLETVSTEHVHFSTCPDRDRFKRPRPARVTDAPAPDGEPEPDGDANFEW